MLDFNTYDLNTYDSKRNCHTKVNLVWIPQGEQDSELVDEGHCFSHLVELLSAHCHRGLCALLRFEQAAKDVSFDFLFAQEPDSQGSGCRAFCATFGVAEASEDIPGPIVWSKTAVDFSDTSDG